MCGRLAQHRAAEKYLASLDLQQAMLIGRNGGEEIHRFNVAPTTRVDLIRPSENGLIWKAERWGWEPSWASRRVRNIINAAREKVATSAYYRAIWPNRAIVAVDGWYEWREVPGAKRKQPYYIRHATNEPLFMAAVGQFSAPNEEPIDTDGFRIVTADAEGGMVDVHDRRPIVFTKEVAREWLSDIALVYARKLLDEQALPADEFVWYPVSQDVGNVRNDGPSLITPA